MARISPKSNVLFLLGCILIIVGIISGVSTYQNDSAALDNVDYRCGMEYMGSNDTCEANGKEYNASEWIEYKKQDAQSCQDNAVWNALKSFGIFFGIGILGIILGYINIFVCTSL